MKINFSFTGDIKLPARVQEAMQIQVEEERKWQQFLNLVSGKQISMLLKAKRDLKFLHQVVIAVDSIIICHSVT